MIKKCNFFKTNFFLIAFTTIFFNLGFFQLDAFEGRTEEHNSDAFHQLDPKNIPNHIAIIMDGNRRWAKQKDLSLYEGYLKGSEALFNIIKTSINLNVKTLTVYAFSTENWSRSVEEIDMLSDLFEYMFVNQKDALIDLGVKVDFIGDISKFNKSVQNSFFELKNACQNGKKLDLILAINYGGRDEITRCFIKLFDDIDKGIIKKEEIDQSLIDKYLDTKNVSDPDLLIRTAKEARLSNFLLWQIAYTEIYISEVYWPDFTENEFFKAILDYQKRRRKVGT